VRYGQNIFIAFASKQSVNQVIMANIFCRKISQTLTVSFNRLTPNDPYRGRTAPLTSKVAFYIFIQQIYVLNILNMVYTVRFSLQNAVCFVIITYLVPVLFTFYIQDVLKLKK